MKRIILIISVLFGYLGSVYASDSFIPLRSKDFSVYLRNSDFGLQYKLGLESELSNNPLWHSLDLGRIEGKKVSSADCTVRDIRQTNQGDIHLLSVEMQHRLLPLHVSVVFTAFGQTGAISRNVRLENTGKYPLHIENTPSLEGVFSRDAYEYSYMDVSWSNERRLHTCPIPEDTVSFVSKAGRSSAEFSPWICLKNVTKDTYYIAQLAWSGNWYMNLFRNAQGCVQVDMGEYFDNGFLMLLPGQRFELPETVMSGAAGSMDQAANNLHRYQRDYALKKQPDDVPLLVQFNSWFPLQQTITAENLIPYIDKASELGCEAFTIDAGWFTKKAWDREAGDWQTNKKTFPAGLGTVADHVRSRGMKFGLWFELESFGDQSDMFKQHPDWCLQYDGKPVVAMNRSHPDYSHPEVFQWALDQFAAMYKECNGIDWVKLDYNISIGSTFETREGTKAGDRLHNHVVAYYAWLDTLQAHYPKLFIENCSSGAMRLDLGIAKHTHASFISDETSPNPSLGMAWSSTLEYLPRALNHWVVGMGNHYAVIDQSLSAGYWDYMFKIPMNGQFGISSRILEWSPELWQCALDNVRLYKRIRSVIANADCYHLTSQPDYVNPQGWTVMQYVAPSARQSLVMAYRTQGGEPEFIARLNGLNKDKHYRVSIGGVVKGTYTGASLQKDGLRILLDEEYRACVVELYQR